MKERLSLLLSLALSLLWTGPAHANEQGGSLFVTFRGEASPLTEQIYFLVSRNGRDWDALNACAPVLVSNVGEKGVRDPFLLRAHDNSRFYLIATDLSINRNGDWGRAQTAGSRSIVIWESPDLVNWSEPRLVPVAPDNAGCTWAPEAVYDEDRGEYLVFWASKTGGDNYGKQRIWAAYTKDFKTFGNPFVYIEKPDTVIDTTILREDGRYYRFSKDEKFKSITMEASKSLMSGWHDVRGFNLDRLEGFEGPTCFRIGPDSDGKSARWCLLLDWYSQGRGYQPFVTDDLRRGRFNPGEPMNFPFHPVRHGTVLPITRQELDRLTAKWGVPNLRAASNQVKAINTFVDPKTGRLQLSVLPDADLTHLDPEFKAGFGIPVEPAGAQDFSKGPVAYRVGDKFSFQVSAVKNHNPVLAGYYADPDILYSHKTGKFYLYPTSDGFDGWSGWYFKTFSSPDLVRWKDEGIILDLHKDVRWADRNAWAPCIIEKQSGGKYRYYFYFTAAQKIGVAVSDDPAGPFKDSGRPLVGTLPKGVRGGQQIDPEVFHDPQSGRDYLYWGNGYMAVAELNPDMVSIRKSSIRILTPDSTYREGTTVFSRKGIYYLLWSQDDTRSPNYRVRYAMSDSPTGPFTIPTDNLVLAKDESAGIFGTGHNSVIQIPERDEWYIVYHRFSFPQGIRMGDAAGFHREVCIDRLEFDAQGKILRVTPTHAGIAPVVVPDASGARSPLGDPPARKAD